MNNPQQNMIEILEHRMRSALQPTFLQVLDESDKHIGHAGHQGGGRHFAVVISATALQGLSRVAAHRKIYALFADLMPERIHALRIEIRD